MWRELDWLGWGTQSCVPARELLGWNSATSVGFREESAPDANGRQHRDVVGVGAWRKHLAETCRRREDGEDHRGPGEGHGEWPPGSRGRKGSREEGTLTRWGAADFFK